MDGFSSRVTVVTLLACACLSCNELNPAFDNATVQGSGTDSGGLTSSGDVGSGSTLPHTSDTGSHGTGTGGGIDSSDTDDGGGTGSGGTHTDSTDTHTDSTDTRTDSTDTRTDSTDTHTASSTTSDSSDGTSTGGTTTGGGTTSSGDTGSVGAAATCLELLNMNPNLPSGSYPIDPDGPGGAAPFLVECDMDTDGGGWTMITLDIAAEELGGAVSCPEPPPVYGIDASNRPYSGDEDGAHHCFYDFAFAGGFSELYLRDYELMSNARNGDNTDIDGTAFVQTDWNVGYDPSETTGDVSFGTPEDPGPVTSFAAEGADFIAWEGESVAWPGPAGTTYAVGDETKEFRIGFSERGDEWEGWFPWSAGEIGLR